MTATPLRVVRRLLAVPLTVGLTAAVVSHPLETTVRAMAVAQPPSSDDGTGADVDSEGADPWGFDDEEAEVETWASLIADQAVDLTLFIAFASLALVSFFRKSVGLKYLTLVAAVVYLGLSKSQLISVVNIYGVLTGNLPVLRYNLAWYLFAGFTVVSTVAPQGSWTVV